MGYLFLVWHCLYSDACWFICVLLVFIFFRCYITFLFYYCTFLVLAYMEFLPAKNLALKFLFRYEFICKVVFVSSFCRDEGVHWGIQNGLYLSRSTIVYFKHNDIESLRNTLEEITVKNKRAKKLRRYIVVEAVYQVSLAMHYIRYIFCFFLHVVSSLKTQLSIIHFHYRGCLYFGK